MRKHIKPDLDTLSSRGIDYLPVVFPGFSYWNKGRHSPDHPLNEIPRNGGRFWWRQVYNAISAGCSMIYGAMFDEVDEGTAMFKLVADQRDLPTQAQDRLVYLNIDREALTGDLKNLTSDRYLWLTDQGGKMLRHEIDLTPKMPIR
jgi:hypothetical protein